MAYTATLVKKDVHGSQRMEVYDVTADANSGSVLTGLSVIECFSLGPVSITTTVFPKIRPNISAASAALNGSVMVSNATSGDRFFLTVYGH